MRILVVQESDWLKRGPHQSHHLMERLSLRGHEIRVIDFEIDWRKSDDKFLFGSLRRIGQMIEYSNQWANLLATQMQETYYK